MKHTLTLTILLLLTLITHADVELGGRGRIDKSTNTFTHIHNLHFSDNEQQGLFGKGGYKPITIELTRECEDINAFNTANPNNTVTTVSWNIAISNNEYGIYGTATNTSLQTLTLGCGNETYCNETNTPQTTTTTTYTLSHRANYYIEMETTFNESEGVVYDSPCSYQLEIPTYSCNGGCEDYTYEELVNHVQTQETINENSLNATTTLLNAVTLNLELWEMGLWGIKMLVILSVIAGIISVILIMYNYLKKLSEDKQ